MSSILFNFSYLVFVETSMGATGILTKPISNWSQTLSKQIEKINRENGETVFCHFSPQQRYLTVSM